MQRWGPVQGCSMSRNPFAHELRNQRQHLYQLAWPNHQTDGDDDDVDCPNDGEKYLRLTSSLKIRIMEKMVANDSGTCFGKTVVGDKASQVKPMMWGLDYVHVAAGACAECLDSNWPGKPRGIFNWCIIWPEATCLQLNSKSS